MTKDTFELTRRKILASTGAIGLAGTGAGLGTSAYFNDRESFEGNTLAAGELDLLVDWQQTYTGPDGLEYVNAHPDHDGDGRQSVLNGDGTATEYAGRNVVDALTCDTEGFDDSYDFASTARPEQDRLVELADVKPGDTGELTFSIHLCDNPGYLWMQGGNLAESGGATTEPEAAELGAEETDDGELAENIEVEMWYDSDCDNVRDGGEAADLMLTLDASGSMLYGRYGGVVSDDPITVGGETHDETTKIDLVERGVRQFLQALVDAGGDVDVRVGALFFDGFDPDDGDLDDPQTRLYGLATPSDLLADLVSFREVVSDLTGGSSDPGGGSGISTGTALEPGIDQAQAELRDNGRGVQSVNVVFTDGEPYRGGHLGDDHFVGVREAAERARKGASDPPGEEPPTDLYVIGDQTSELRAQNLVEDMAGPAGSDGGHADFLFDLTDSAAIPGVFRRVALIFLPEELFFSGSLAEAMAALQDGKGIPLDANRVTAFDELDDPDDAPTRECFMPEVTQCLGVRWRLPTTVGNEVQGDAVSFDLGFYTEQCRHNGGGAPEV